MKKILFFALIIFSFQNCSSSKTSTISLKNNNDGKSISMKNKNTPEQIVQKNLDAYNALDLETFMSCFHKEITMYNYGIAEPSAKGLEEVRKIYKGLFDQSPSLHSNILKRIVFENKVIDHESITGRLGSKDIIEMVLIYEVKDEKIIKITAIKK
jgi:hypothetical protein